jgi:hypothetical protein
MKTADGYGKPAPVLVFSSVGKPAESVIVVSRTPDPLKAVENGAAVFELSNTDRASLPDLPPGLYYWTVEAKDARGRDMSAARPYSFRVVLEPPLPAPRGRLPASGAVVDASGLSAQGDLSLSWKAVPGADAYLVTLWRARGSTDKSGVEPLLRSGLVSGTAWTIHDMVRRYGGDSSYVWEIEAVALDHAGAISRRGSPARSVFTLRVAPPEATEVLE